MSKATIFTRVGGACFACLAGLGLVLASAVLAHAVYGPRTVIGSDYQQWSSTTSTDGITGGDNVCSNTFFCYVLFQPTPQGKPLIVQHVSCRFRLVSGEPTEVYLTSRKGQALQFRRTMLVPFFLGQSTNGSNWAINAPVKHLIESGERAVVFLLGTQLTFTNPDCSISGQLIQP